MPQESGLYYLQSRYYDPNTGRFINADAYASTGQGLIANNMFVYCNNNPLMYVDTQGTRPDLMGNRLHIVNPLIFDSDESSQQSLEMRDVTDEVTLALNTAVKKIAELKVIVELFLGDNEASTLCLYLDFYGQVDHAAPWDIKRKDSWEATIGTVFPGDGTEVIFDGLTMTPENLGNFTYGFLGHAYGIPLGHLIPGSWYAADFPTGGEKLDNEIFDWLFIILGYETAVQVFPEGV